jgi:uncharacterized protein (TIGR04141 family)
MADATPKTQSLSIRLLRAGRTPEDSVRDGTKLQPWPAIEGGLYEVGSTDEKTPRWVGLLELGAADAAAAKNRAAYAIGFINASGRWFALTWGLGHTRLKDDAVEQDFGLKVVLNTVDKDGLRTVDSRTPDDNTLTRRSQASRRSDQTAFALDVERDIVRGIEGAPRDAAFGAKVSGTDALRLVRIATAAELPGICAAALTAYGLEDYKAAGFGWIDQVRHIRDKLLAERLDAQLAAAFQKGLDGDLPDTLHLAFPVVYDPNKPSWIGYSGFRSRSIFPDLDVAGYIEAMHDQGVSAYDVSFLRQHRARQVDEQGVQAGEDWTIRACTVFETELDGRRYLLSCDRWYSIDKTLVEEVEKFFDAAEKVNLPPALAGEDEEAYNKRIAAAKADWLCLDRKLERATGATSPIEVCDFLGKEADLIHIKDKTSSSRLSHLFNQGTVSARTIKIDGEFRDKVRARAALEQAPSGRTDFETIIPAATEDVPPNKLRVIYGVLTTSAAPRLPFFSLLTFRQASRELRGLGFRCAFGWITKPVAPAKARKPKPKAP